MQKIAGPMRTEQEWRSLAEKGDRGAQSEQCSTHAFKNDVDSDYYREIVTWCQDDADEGSLQGEYLLAKSYANGQGGLSQNSEEAYFWYAVRIIDKSIPTSERDDTAAHLTLQQIDFINERVRKWKEKLCASNPNEHNAKVERDWHCVDSH